MLKKIILAGCFVTAVCYGVTVNAQSISGGTFSVAHDTISATTTGTIGTPSNATPSSYVDMHNSISNTSTTDVTFAWKFLVDESTIPAGWGVPGFCDNVTCYDQDGHWNVGEEHISTKYLGAPPGTSSNPSFGTLWLHFSAPTTAADGVGIVRFQIRTLDQTDTITYILTKQTTGVSIINQNDARVKLFPNPAASYINVYAAQSLHPETISILDLTGRQVATMGVQAGSETTNVDISTLAAGMYMVRITDIDNKVITSRKFTKQ